MFFASYDCHVVKKFVQVSPCIVSGTSYSFCNSVLDALLSFSFFRSTHFSCLELSVDSVGLDFDVKYPLFLSG